MTEQDFIVAILDGFGPCTTVTETYTEAELLADYQGWRGRQAHRSPLKNDNRLARQAYLTELYRAEDLYWQRNGGQTEEQRKTFMKQVLADVTRLKARVRAGVVAHAPVAVQPVSLTALPALQEELLALGM
jgi:hypothetical protein